MCAFIVGQDIRKANILGNGAPMGSMEQQIFYTKDNEILNFDPYSQTSTWVRIMYATLTATESTAQTPYYDQFNEIGTKMGRSETTFEIAQDLASTIDSIKALKNQELWYAEGIQDDRQLIDNTTGNPIFQELTLYKAKLIDFNDDKGEIFKCTGSGKYDMTQKKVIVKGVTPVQVLPVGNATASTGSYTLTVNAKDLYGADIDLADLSDLDLAGEITAINISKQAGTPTITVSNGAADNIKTVNIVGTGSLTLKIDVVTRNAGVFSATKVVTVS